MHTPHENYKPSIRPFPSRLPDIQYDKDFQVRHVRRPGVVKWRGALLYISETLEGQWVGFKPVHDGVWALHYGCLPLALYDARDEKLHKYEMEAKAKKV